MSYILNALKKAEQDRLRDNPKDLEDFASARWDPYQQQPSSSKTAIILGLICILALSLVSLFYFADFSSFNQQAKNTVTEPKSVIESSVSFQEPEVVIESNLNLLPVLDITGHMYFAKGSSSNRLFANNQSFKEGDLIAKGWMLTAVGIDGIEIANHSRTEFITYP